MHRAGGNEDLVARRHFQAYIIHDHFQTAFDHGDQFVGAMDEIQPLLSRRVDEQVARVAPLPPIGGDQIGIDRGGEFSALQWIAHLVSSFPE